MAQLDKKTKASNLFGMILGCFSRAEPCGNLFNMNRSILILFFLLAMIFSIFGQANTEHYRLYDGKGNPATMAQVLESIGNNDVTFLGEMHDDSVGHALQFEIFKAAVEKYSANRKITLSLEMFESDVQIVLDEYLAGLISEKKFMDDSRPWGNYKTDYRPLVELAKEKKFAVIAANAPRRYVNMVSRGGRDKLNGLSKEAKAFLPPLPYAQASEAYSKKFKALMGGAPEAQLGLNNILDSQSLWDAGMAYNISQAMTKNGLIIHLNGAFHTENRLGTVEHLLKYKPKTKVLVVTMRYENDFKNFDKTKHTDLGDFVILTDASQPRSQR
jgi:uncharacterized iron-regulated protein